MGNNDGQDRYDVVVVGAGFTGLRAATTLDAAGLRVAVLEARDRVGGKVESRHDACGDRVDTGGQFISDDMPLVLALVRSQGKRLADVLDDGRGLAFTGDGPTADPVGLAQVFDAAWDAWEELATDPPPPMDPTESADDWLAARIHDPVMLRAARGAVGGLMCMPIDRIPVTKMAEEVRDTPMTVDELQYIVVETMHQVAIDLAATLPEPVRLSTPVDLISRDGAGVVVHATGPAGATRLQADHVLLAVPPAALPLLRFEPQLPAEVSATFGAYVAGDVFKFLVRYERAFWADHEAGSLRRFLNPAGLHIRAASPQSDRPTLVIFLGGAGAYQLQALTVEEREARIVDLLVEAYGPEAAAPVSFLERDWRPDRWGAGGYNNEVVDARFAPPHADAVGLLRSGVPGITFASTELASAFPGYIEGALTAGTAAADAVLTALGRPR